MPLKDIKSPAPISQCRTLNPLFRLLEYAKRTVDQPSPSSSSPASDLRVRTPAQVVKE